MKLDFCGIDFETAYRLQSSACSMGLVRVRDGLIADTFYSLINPPAWMYFIDAFTGIHGLARDDVSSSPSFDAVWKRMKEFIRDDYLVAHNTRFDCGVLAGCLDYYKIDNDVPRFDCSLKAARRKWPDLQNHQLNTVSEFLGIELNHHDALSDAIACAKIFVEAN